METRERAKASKKAKSDDLSAYDWVAIQSKHDGGILWTRLPKECGVSPTKLKKAREAGLVTKHHYHQWRAYHKRSVPCEAFKEALRASGVNFVEEFQPLPNRQFSIDVAFPDRRLGVEINGNQHYEEAGVLREYYQQRHDLIVESGWTILEVHFSIVYDSKRLEQLVLRLATGQEPDIDYSFYIKQPKQPKKAKYGDRPTYFTALREQAKIAQRPRVQMLIESGIDFSKFGWVNKAASLLGIREQRVSKWMKRFAPELYSKCFHRGVRVKH